MDEYWKSALLAALDLVPFCDVLYTPSKFFPYSRKFYPLEYSLCETGSTNWGFCVQKDLLHHLNPKILDIVNKPEQIFYANDVFVVACSQAPKGSRWFYLEEQRYKEYVSLRESALSGSLGKNTTPYWRKVKNSDRPKVLIVGATNMGNVGDDLTAIAIGGHVSSIVPDCSLYFSDFRVSRSDIQDFDFVIVGGGGIVYSSQFGENSTDNLANYLKLPFFAKEKSVPCALFGVGVQGLPGHLSKDPLVRDFLMESLQNTSVIVVRDSQSKTELATLTNKEVFVLPDLVFSFANQYHFYKNVFDRATSRSYAFAGELFSDRLSFFNNLFKSEIAKISNFLDGQEIKYFIMSNDDLPHSELFTKLLLSRGIHCKVVDLRGLSIFDLLNTFRSVSGVITTRFHGLVLSLIAGCPVISVDLSFGKHSRLIRESLPSINGNIIDEACDSDSILCKLEALFIRPASLLPNRNEIDAVASLSNEYTNVLRKFFDRLPFVGKS